jgi:thiol-disulfide isomerase/thioredoxin
MKAPFPSTSRISSILTLAASACLLPSAVLAGDIVCRANYDFCVEVDGAYPQDARFFTSDVRGKFLVDMPSKLNDVLLDLASRTAVAVPPDIVTRDENTRLMKVKDALPKGAESYALSIDGPVLRFQTPTSKVRVLKVLDRSPVIGPVALDSLLADRPEYREGSRLYQPEKTAMESIRQWKQPLEIEAFFATWCPHCKEYMPKFLRVMKDAANSNIKLTLIGVPKGFGLEKGPWEGKSIQAIPAIIINYQGKEVTRLGTQPGAVPEAELAGILGALK